MEQRIEDNPSLVEGVFRDQEDADRAIQALKEAGFRNYNVRSEGMPDTGRIVVAVMAEDRHQEASDILVRNGSNNADLPAGATLDSGTIVKDTTVAPDDVQASSQGYEV